MDKEKENNANEKDGGSKKMEIPKDVQIKMMKFFLETSIPRKKAMNNKLLSEKKEDR